MKFKIIYLIIFTAVILAIISGCGIENASTPADDVGESPPEIILQEPTSEPITASPFAYIPGGIKIGDGISIIEGVYFDSDNYEEHSVGIEGEYAYVARPEMQEAGGPQTETGESGFAGNIGWTDAGEWVQYTIDAEKSGTYSIAAHLASALSEAESNNIIEVLYDEISIGIVPGIKFTSWQEYNLYPVGYIDMTEGVHIIKVKFLFGNTNLAALEVSYIG